MIWENGTETCIISYMKRVTSPGSMHDTGCLGLVHWDDPSIQYRASNLDWQLVSYMILYMFQCHSPKSSHPLPLPQSRKDCSIHQCLFCCLIYRVIVNLSGTLRACLVLIYNHFFPFSSWIFSYHLLLAGVLLKCVDYIESQCFLEPFVRL